MRPSFTGAVMITERSGATASVWIGILVGASGAAVVACAVGASGSMTLTPDVSTAGPVQEEGTDAGVPGRQAISDPDTEAERRGLRLIPDIGERPVWLVLDLK